MPSGPGLGSALVKISYEPLDVGQLVVQVLAAQFLFVVVGAVLFFFFKRGEKKKMSVQLHSV